jgi:hypothetical protein
MTVMVKRTGPSVDELRSLARRARNVAQARRLLAVASVLEGALRDPGGRGRRHDTADLA